MVGLGQPMLDIVCDADTVEDVRTGEASAGAFPVPGKVGEGHAPFDFAQDRIIGEHGVDLVGEDLHHGLKEGGAFHLLCTFVELDVGELRDAIDGEEHHQPAIGVTQFAAVDVDMAGLTGLEAFALPAVSSTGNREMPWRWRQRYKALRLR